MNTVVRVTETVHNQLMKLLVSFSSKGQACNARCYLAGEDKRGVIRYIIYLKRRGGCEVMPYISNRTIARGLIQIAKKKLTSRLIIRLGLELSDMDDYQIHRMDIKLISITPESMLELPHYSNIIYKIVRG